jgi:hypothetical protein
MRVYGSPAALPLSAVALVLGTDKTTQTIETISAIPDIL